ncbi:MAG: hypothetical protein EA342_06495 [Leptolyngbya sp. LCM1.Bin17]|nr:MAG: hypothetical protein EA342_06495 [Leptolyngbya sp. LCM1.Bin17]
MMRQNRILRRVRWLALGLLAVFVLGQLSPYGALAVRGATTPSSNRPRAEAVIPTTDLLAQLHQHPGGTVSLPAFDPTVNTFQFSNQELIDAIDLDRHAQDWEAVLTGQMQRLFGTQVCIAQDGRNCLLTAAAHDWLKTQLGRLDQGISEGMAAAVLDLWQPRSQPRLPWWQQLINFLLGRTVFGLARTLFDLQAFIANLFLMQGVTEVFQPTQVIRDTFTPTQILLSILNVFLTGSLDPFTMGVYRTIQGALTEGHSLTPYQVEERENGKYWVYVYDSNYPLGRATSPTDLHIEFDTTADTWSYQPTANGPSFQGDAQSKNLELTQLSWRQLPADTDAAPTVQGAFSCPFCGLDPEPETAPAPTIDITLIGEGQLSVIPYDLGLDPAVKAPVDLVPFKGGLNRDVPASYHLPAESLNHPLKVTLTGISTAQVQPTTLHLTGPGYTASFAGLRLPADQSLSLYVVPTTAGPELTFVADRTTDMPQMSIHLSDDTRVYQFDSSTPETGFSRTERQVSKSSGFDLSGLTLPAGQRVALSAKGDRRRLYFADDHLADSRYTLSVTNRMVIKDRIQLGEQHPDWINYTLTYDEQMRVRNIQVEGQTQAFFDYDPAFIDPSDRPRQELLAIFEQREFPITIAYEPLTPNPAGPGPLRLEPTATGPTSQRMFQGTLRKG